MAREQRRKRKGALISIEQMLLIVATIAIAAIAIAYVFGLWGGSEQKLVVNTANSYLTYAGNNTYKMYLYVSNPTSNPVNITSITILDDAGNEIPVTLTSNTTFIEPRRSVAITGSIPATNIGIKTSYKIFIWLETGEVITDEIPVR